MRRPSTVLERLVALEVITVAQADDVKEIKKDVKLLLETKWKSDGKRMALAAIVAMVVSLVVPLLGR